MQSSEAWARIQAHPRIFFKVSFRRKRPKYAKDEKGRRYVMEPAGAIREMTCRLRVRKYVKGVLPEGQRKVEDLRHNVLTVFDTTVFHELRRKGLSKMEAGRQSYRRINMQEVISLSLPTLEQTYKNDNRKHDHQV